MEEIAFISEETGEVIDRFEIDEDTSRILEQLSIDLKMSKEDVILRAINHLIEVSNGNQ